MHCRLQTELPQLRAASPPKFEGKAADTHLRAVYATQYRYTAHGWRVACVTRNSTSS